MRPRLLPLLLLATTLSDAGETRIELPPVLIECGLNDIAVILVPAVGGSDVRYELTRPDGEVVKLDHIDHTRREGSSDVTNLKNQSVSVGREGNASSDVIAPTFYPTFDSRPDIGRNVTRGDVIDADYHQLTLKFEVFNVNRKGGNATDIFAGYQMRMKRNDFMVGPLGDGDLGNWVLSVFCTDSKGAPVELFQVMSFVIVEPVPARASNLELKEGATFEPSFAYPIRGLESCELRGPRASDRPYGRDRALDYCGYAVPNVTEDDQGVWTIVGVGAIVYEATVRLKVHNKSL
ncbi:unnamed protein product, partial [Iphiclides podalirius]